MTRYSARLARPHCAKESNSCRISSKEMKSIRSFVPPFQENEATRKQDRLKSSLGLAMNWRNWSAFRPDGTLHVVRGLLP
jgi:hypothetical protein